MWSVLLAVSPSRSLSVSLLSLSNMATSYLISELTEKWYNYYGCCVLLIFKTMIVVPLYYIPALILIYTVHW